MISNRKNKIFLVFFILLALIMVPTSFAANAEEVEIDSDISMYETTNDNSIKEVDSPTTIYVSNDGNDDGNGSQNNPYNSISQAVDSFDSSVNDKIYILNGNYNFDSQLRIDKDVTIVGESQENVIFNGGNTNGILYLYDGTILLENISFVNGNDAYGAALRLDSGMDVTVKNCLFENNTGPAIALRDTYFATNLNVIGSTFNNNKNIQSMGGFGAAIYFGYGILNVTDSVFTNNSVNSTGYDGFAAHGGAVYLYSNTPAAYFDRCTFINNTAKNGGAIGAYCAGDITVENSIFINNTATNVNGSSIYDNQINSAELSLNLKNNTFDDEDNAVVALGNVNIVYLDNNAFISANSVEMNYGDDEYFEVTLVDGEGNPIANKEIIISFTDYYNNIINYTVTTNSTGVASLSLRDKAIGRYTVVSRFEGDDTYDSVSTQNTVNIAGDYNIIIILDETYVHIMEGESHLITGTVCDEFNEPYDYLDGASVTVSWTSYTGSTHTISNAAIINGNQFTFDIGDCSLATQDANYTLTFTASDDYGYYPMEAQANLTVSTKINIPMVILDVIYVDVLNGNDVTGNGSEGNPLASLQVALALNNALNGDRTIVVKSGNYSFGLQTIYKDVTIVGDGDVIFKQASGNHGLFSIEQGAEVSFNNINFTNGYVTPMPLALITVRDYSTVNINNSKFYNNTGFDGGVISVDEGYVLINNSKFFNNTAVLEGGAIMAYHGSLTILNSEFINNTARDGGALYLLYDINTYIDNSIFDSNQALEGNIVIGGGGAIYSSSQGTNIINNSKIINNYADLQGGAIYIQGANLEIYNSYLIDNSVGYATYTKTNTIYSPTIYSVNLTVSNSILMSSDTSNILITIGETETSNINLNTNYWGSNQAPGYYESNVDVNDYVIIIAEINGNEIHANETYNLVISFMKNENGVISELDTLMPSLNISLTSDLGQLSAEKGIIENNRLILTYESENIGRENITITSNNRSYYVYSFDVVEEDLTNYWFINDTGFRTLEDAIEAAGYGDIIKGLPGTYIINGLDIGHRYFPLEPWSVNKTITITSMDPNNPVILSGNNNDRLFFVDSGSVLYLENLIIANGSSLYGGAISTMGGSLYAPDAELYINNCTFVNNSAGEAGAIYSWGSIVYINNTVFINNFATDTYAGAIFIGSGRLILENSQFIGNDAETYAGAIYLTSSENQIINNTVFRGNTASRGGAIFTNLGDVHIDNCLFDSNQALNKTSFPASGGALYVNSNNLEITNSQFVNNYAELNGGALELGNTVTTITSVTTGEVILEIDHVVIDDCLFNSNRAANEGGAIYAGDNFPYVNITDSIITNNVATSGSALIDNYGVIIIENTLIDSNIATDGSTIVIFGDEDYFEVYESNLTLINVDIIDNEALSDILISNGYSSLIINDSNVNAENIGIENYGSLSLNQNEITNIYSIGTIKTPTFVVVLNNSTLTADIGETTIIYATVEDDNGNIIYGSDLTFVVNGETIESQFNNNRFIADYPVELEEVVVSAEYADTGLLDSTTKTGIVIGLKSDTPSNETNGTDEPEIPINSAVLDGQDLEMIYMDGSRYYVTLTYTNGTAISGVNVTFIINSREYIRTTDENGTAYITINLNSGSYIIETRYKNTSISNSILVQATVSGNDIVKIFRNGTHYEATFINSDGSLLTNTNVTFNINGVMYTRATDENGVARLNINLNPGMYIITAINPSTGEMASNDIEVLPSIIENNDLVKYFRNESQYSVKVLDNSGNPLANQVVTFNINGVFYNRTSNEEGVATLNINLNPGNYIITAEYGEYRVSNDIDVLPVLTGEDLVMSYLDGSTFNAKLVDGQGNPLADEIITFNVNGVFYNRITDDEGIARLNINLLAGEYIITSMYDQARISNTISIS